jgi:hypothetical protein
MGYATPRPQDTSISNYTATLKHGKKIRYSLIQ